MDWTEQIRTLNDILLREMPGLQPQARAVPRSAAAQRRLLRALMNIRQPRPLPAGFLALQDEVLGAEREEKGVVEADALPATAPSNCLVSSSL